MNSVTHAGSSRHIGVLKICIFGFCSEFLVFRFCESGNCESKWDASYKYVKAGERKLLSFHPPRSVASELQLFECLCVRGRVAQAWKVGWYKAEESHAPVPGE